VFNGILYVLTTRFPSPTPGGNRSTPSWRRGLSRPPPHLPVLERRFFVPSVLTLTTFVPRRPSVFSNSCPATRTFGARTPAPKTLRVFSCSWSKPNGFSSSGHCPSHRSGSRTLRQSFLAPAVLELRSIGTSFLAALELLPRKRFAFPHAPVLETLRVSRTTSFQDVVLRTVAPFRGLPKRIPLSASPHNLFTGRLPA